MRALKTINFSCLFITVILLSSCSYSLRDNSIELFNKDLIVLSDNSDLNLELIEQLKTKNNKIYRTEDIGRKKSLIIKVKDHAFNRYSAAIGAGARTTQVRLDYRITYELIDTNLISIKNTFKSINYLSFNQSDLLAMQREEQILMRNFVNDAIKNMEFRLALIANEN